MRVIGQCHTMLHQNGVVRIQSDIRVGSRTDKKQGFKGQGGGRGEAAEGGRGLRIAVHGY